MFCIEKDWNEFNPIESDWNRLNRIESDLFSSDLHPTRFKTFLGLLLNNSVLDFGVAQN